MRRFARKSVKPKVNVDFPVSFFLLALLCDALAGSGVGTSG